jgi:hypothetical protein
MFGKLPNHTFTVSVREAETVTLLLSRTEAHTQYHKARALAPYLGYIDVRLDSNSICPPPKK